MPRKILRSSLQTVPRTVCLTLGSNPSALQNERKAPTKSLVLFFGGERGIRTLGRVLADTRFPVVRLRPAQPSLQVAHSLNIITHIIGKINT